jgi:FixJ family two-component response regulator
MPNLTGLELLGTLRRRKVSAPVIIVTGREDSLLRQQAEAAGAVALLAKPVASDVLVLTITKSIAPN